MANVLGKLDVWGGHQVIISDHSRHLYIAALQTQPSFAVNVIWVPASAFETGQFFLVSAAIC